MTREFEPGDTRPGEWEDFDVGGERGQLRRTSPTFRCPCGGTYWLCEARGPILPADAASDTVVMHEVEPCEKFIDSDVIEYLRYARSRGLNLVE